MSVTIYKSLKYSGLKLPVISAKTTEDPKTGKRTLDKGKHVKFVNGIYKTDDKDCIKVIEDYKKKYPEEIRVVTEKELKKK